MTSGLWTHIVFSLSGFSAILKTTDYILDLEELFCSIFFGFGNSRNIKGDFGHGEGEGEGEGDGEQLDLSYSGFSISVFLFLTCNKSKVSLLLTVGICVMSPMFATSTHNRSSFWLQWDCLDLALFFVKDLWKCISWRTTLAFTCNRSTSPELSRKLELARSLGLSSRMV